MIFAPGKKGVLAIYPPPTSPLYTQQYNEEMQAITHDWLTEAADSGKALNVAVELLLQDFSNIAADITDFTVQLDNPSGIDVTYIPVGQIDSEPLTVRISNWKHLLRIIYRYAQLAGFVIHEKLDVEDLMSGQPEARPRYFNNRDALVLDTLRLTPPVYLQDPATPERPTNISYRCLPLRYALSA